MLLKYVIVALKRALRQTVALLKNKTVIERADIVYTTQSHYDTYNR